MQSPPSCFGWLIPIGQDGKDVTRFPIKRQLYVIGSAEGVNIRIPYKGIHPWHVSIVVDSDGVVTMRNIHQSRAFVVNGKHEPHLYTCHHLDIIQLGKHTFRFESVNATASPSSAPSTPKASASSKPQQSSKTTRLPTKEASTNASAKKTLTPVPASPKRASHSKPSSGKDENNEIAATTTVAHVTSVPTQELEILAVEALTHPASNNGSGEPLGDPVPDISRASSVTSEDAEERTVKTGDEEEISLSQRPLKPTIRQDEPQTVPSDSLTLDDIQNVADGSVDDIPTSSTPTPNDEAKNDIETMNGDIAHQSNGNSRQKTSAKDSPVERAKKAAPQPRVPSKTPKESPKDVTTRTAKRSSASTAKTKSNDDSSSRNERTRKTRSSTVSTKPSLPITPAKQYVASSSSPLHQLSDNMFEDENNVSTIIDDEGRPPKPNAKKASATTSKKTGRTTSKKALPDTSRTKKRARTVNQPTKDSDDDLDWVWESKRKSLGTEDSKPMEEAQQFVYAPPLAADLSPMLQKEHIVTEILKQHGKSTHTQVSQLAVEYKPYADVLRSISEGKNWRLDLAYTLGNPSFMTTLIRDGKFIELPKPSDD